jgi:hypothetical protein
MTLAYPRRAKRVRTPPRHCNAPDCDRCPGGIVLQPLQRTRGRGWPPLTSGPRPRPGERGGVPFPHCHGSRESLLAQRKETTTFVRQLPCTKSGALCSWNRFKSRLDASGALESHPPTRQHVLFQATHGRTYVGVLVYTSTDMPGVLPGSIYEQRHARCASWERRSSTHEI